MSTIRERRITDQGLEIGLAALTQDRIREAVQAIRNSETGAKMKVYHETCMRCGMCAPACHFYVSNDNDPSYAPVAKVHQTMTRILNGEDIGPQDVYDFAQIAYTECNLCRRCAFYCPVGIDIGYIMSTVRRFCYKLGMVPQYLNDTGNSHASTMNQMWVKEDEWTDSLLWQEEEARDEFPHIRIPLDKEGADIFYSVIGPEPKFQTQLIYQAACIMHVAGLDWTMPSFPGWDNSDMSMYIGDFETMGRVKKAHFDAAQKLKCKRIVMGECGHAFRSVHDVGNRWLGAKDSPVPIVHSIKFFADLIREGKIKIAYKIDDPVTIHDPCNVIRGRGLMDELRYVTHALCSNVIEMTPNREYNYCCCAGGGVINCGPPYKNSRVQGNRVKAEQIKRTGATIVISPCHNCHSGLEDIVHGAKIDAKISFLGDLIYPQMEKPAHFTEPAPCNGGGHV
ncbi:MAG: (Fe-S)-binding protein [Deltaproteobacteria bacterium]|nr:(Fe-S)-binding protein [Deltaproteobacteria bacterium]